MIDSKPKTCNIAAQYIRSVYATAHVRPYENKTALTNAVDVSLAHEPLPEDGHYRVELSVTLTGQNAQGVPCFEAGAGIEAIVVARNLEPHEFEAMVKHQICGLLLGTARVAIANASSQTGYGPVTLPPLSGERILELSQRTG